MANNNPAIPNLSSLEHDDEFRAHYLFFLQMANTYIVSIFLHCFNDGKRKKILLTCLAKLDEDSTTKLKRKEISKQDLLSDTFKQAMYSSTARKTAHFEVFSSDFQSLMNALPDTRKKAFKGKLTEHAIPITFDTFLDLIDEMRLKRNYLQKWKIGKSKRFTETKVLRALGLLLPSKQHQHFIGSMEHAKKRLSKTQTINNINTLAVRTVFSKARKDRAEASLAYYGKTGKKTVLSKAERQNRKNAMDSFYKKYNEFYPEGCWPRYNFHLFKTRCYFFGAGNIKYITSLLDTDTPHFQRDIEAVFETSTHINRILNLACIRLQAADNGLTKAQKKARVGAVQGNLRAVRNGIAHNTPFFHITHQRNIFTPQQVFECFFNAYFHPHIIATHGPPLEQINDLYSKIFGLFNKQKYHWAFPVKNINGDAIDHTPPIVIRYWSKPMRDKYASREKWRLDNRSHVTNLMGEWAKDLRRARDDAINLQNSN